jgi:penicillin amidase
LDGLREEAKIIVDRWGVPHIYAASSDDAFRVQGFNAARERLWQLDFWRRRGLGQLAEVFGAQFVERDRAARLFLYRGDMHNEWLAYGSDTKRVTTAFVEGVNAYIRLTRDDPALLPIEFTELGYRPAMWEPVDVARIRSHGLFANIRDELTRALTLREYGSAAEDLRRRREPPHDLVLPDGLDLDLLPDGLLDVYELATSAPDFTLPGGGKGTRVLPEGSNNWVVSKDRTATGRPILANDPHRALTLPSLRYLVHLSAPGMDVIGGGEPALPGVSIGHNGRIAFGMTLFAIDQEDLYVYETDPDDPTAYLYQDRWEPMRIVRETIAVGDSSPVEVELAFTRHGPVIHADADKNVAFAVRAAWLEPGMAPYLGSIDYMRSRDLDEFIAAMNRWGAPPENQVFADTEGNIGWKACGLTPIRPNWDGTLPVPGDGRYEWAGFYDMDELPGVLNPESGWFASANEMNLPKDFPSERTMTHDWYAPYRRQRIGDVLNASTTFSIDDAVRLQSDVLSLPAQRILAVLRALDFDRADPVEGLTELLDWDGDLRPDSAAAALFEVWYRRHLRPALLTRALTQVVSGDLVAQALDQVRPREDLLADARVDLELLESPGDRLGPNADAAIREIVRRTLPAAVREVTELLGQDRSAWAWGRLHVARLTHPLAPLLASVAEAELTAGPVARGGSGDTVCDTAYGTDFNQMSGSTFRIVIDVGNWDGSMALNSPGQSGRPDSPHFKDLLQPWADGAAFPLLYSREKIDEAAAHILTIHPCD